MGEGDFFVCNKKDLRVPCSVWPDRKGGKCENISESLSNAIIPGGTWCYGYSLRGARKFLRKFPKTKDGKYKVGTHIDDVIKNSVRDGKIKAISFNPPIVWHEEGAIRDNTDIPWEW